MVVRLPLDLKEQLDIASKGQGISQSRLAVELISQGLNQSVSLEAMLEDIEKEPPTSHDDQIDLEDWLKRI